MNTPLTIETKVRFRCVRSGRKKLEEAPAGPPPEPVPRIARLMALAIHFDRQIRAGVFASYSDIARLSALSRNRVSQVMDLLNLPPAVQERLLFWKGPGAPHLEDVTRYTTAWPPQRWTR
jgi:hypothetical protein